MSRSSFGQVVWEYFAKHVLVQKVLLYTLITIDFVLYVIYLCLVCFCASGVYYCNIPFKYHFTCTRVWTLLNCFFPACKSALKKLYCLALYQILIKRRRIKYRSFYLLRASVYLNLHIVFHKLRKLYDLSDFVVGP